MEENHHVDMQQWLRRPSWKGPNIQLGEDEYMAEVECKRADEVAGTKTAKCCPNDSW